MKTIILSLLIIMSLNGKACEYFLAETRLQILTEMVNMEHNSHAKAIEVLREENDNIRAVLLEEQRSKMLLFEQIRQLEEDKTYLESERSRWTTYGTQGLLATAFFAFVAIVVGVFAFKSHCPTPSHLIEVPPSTV